MPTGFDLLHLGDLGFTVPAATAIAAVLLASRAPRWACRWILLFACGMLLVGVSKVAFMAWGVGIEGVAFKAFSGHAAGATAVLPFLIYLGLLFVLAIYRRAGAAIGALPWRRLDRGIRHLSLAAGVGLGALVAFQLVRRCEHSVSEALAGCAIGAVVSAAAIVQSRRMRLQPGMAAACFGAAFLLAAYLMSSMHVAWWLVKAARMLTRGQPLHSLSFD